VGTLGRFPCTWVVHVSHVVGGTGVHADLGLRGGLFARVSDGLHCHHVTIDFRRSVQDAVQTWRDEQALGKELLWVGMCVSHGWNDKRILHIRLATMFDIYVALCRTF
jgi:hypothetical protein